MPFWNGKDKVIPESGINFSGKWYKGKKDDKGKEIPASHPNARFTVELKHFPNVDENLDSPEGVLVSAMIYGGRDSDTSVPVEEAFNWEHGIITKGAALESETTAATIGKTGVRVINPMSNIDFLSITIGKYIQHNIDFGKKIKKPVKIFGVNYFLRDENGNFLNEKKDKIVWLYWMEGRCNNEYKALKTPTGLIPIYDDIKKIFKERLNKDYSKEDYIKQFKIRIRENLLKIERVTKFYKEKVKDAPEILFKILEEQKNRLLIAQKEFGDYINPFFLKEEVD